MWSHKKEKGFAECPRRGIASQTHKKNRWCRWIFPLTGLIALIWFLVRVIPKPSRATYPCQRVAFPIASSFVAYIVGLCCTTVALHKARQRLQKSRYLLAVTCIVIGIIAAFLTISIDSQQALADFVPTDPPNSPIGEAKGIFHGRVVWVHDPNATYWDPAWNERTDIFFWDDDHTNQVVVEEMMSKAVCWLTGQPTVAGAWDALLKNFNQVRGKGNVGYTSGERVVIKPNHNNQSSHANTDNGDPDTPPAVYVALLKQLIHKVGIPQEYITICESSRYIDDKTYYACSSLFPNVRYVENQYSSTGGRLPAEPVADTIIWSGINVTTGQSIVNYPVARSFVEADYVINLARMQPHSLAGVTLCGKNWYGCFCVSPTYDRQFHSGDALHNMLPWVVSQMGNFRPPVDLMGHEHLGAKTLLYVVDGLWGFGEQTGSPPIQYSYSPFNNDYPSSFFVSQDPVAIDSVCLDFLRMQFALFNREAVDDYLHEAALANDPPSGTFYDPEADGNSMPSLGMHEHWNNSIDKQYSRNLGIGDGIELISSEPQMCADWFKADITADCVVDFADLAALTEAWLAEPNLLAWNVLCDIAPDEGDGVIDSQDFAVFAAQWQGGVQTISAAVSLDNQWMYQNLPERTDSDLTASVTIAYDPLNNSGYTYSWEFVLPADANVPPSIVAGGGSGDAFWTFAAPGCDDPRGLSDSGQVFKVRLTVTGLDHGNTGTAEADFGIALLGDVNNDGVVNIADRSIINAFWRTGAAGSFTLNDCDLNCDGAVNVADRSVANAIWRGSLGQNSVSSPCLFR